MENVKSTNIFFYYTDKESINGFECNSLRRNLKASLEAIDVTYKKDISDKEIDCIAYINPFDFNPMSRLTVDPKIKNITFAFFTEMESNKKMMSKVLATSESKEKYKIKDSTKNLLNAYDLVFVPSEEAKKYLEENDITSKIAVLGTPTRKSKFDINTEEVWKLVYIYYHINIENKIVYTILDSTDEKAAKRLLKLAKIFNNVKFLVIGDKINSPISGNFYKLLNHHPSNVIVSDIVEEDIYKSVVLNSEAMILLNSTFGPTKEIMEAIALGKPILGLQSSSFSDILIDKETAYVYNDLKSFIEGFNLFTYGKLPSLSDKQKRYFANNELSLIGTRLVNEYIKIKEDHEND